MSLVYVARCTLGDNERNNYWKLLRLLRLESCFLCCAKCALLNARASSRLPLVDIRALASKRRGLNVTWRCACACVINPNWFEATSILMEGAVQKQFNWLDVDRLDPGVVQWRQAISHLSQHNWNVLIAL